MQLRSIEEDLMITEQPSKNKSIATVMGKVYAQFRQKFWTEGYDQFYILRILCLDSLSILSNKLKRSVFFGRNSYSYLEVFAEKRLRWKIKFFAYLLNSHIGRFKHGLCFQYDIFFNPFSCGLTCTPFNQSG